VEQSDYQILSGAIGYDGYDGGDGEEKDNKKEEKGKEGPFIYLHWREYIAPHQCR